LNQWWALLLLGGGLCVGSVILIAIGRGTEKAGKIVVPFLNVPIANATVSLVVLVLGIGLGIYSATKLDDTDEPEKVSIATIKELVDAPEPPAVSQSDAGFEEASLRWLLAYFDETRIEIDAGSENGLASGDFMVAIPDREHAEDLPPESLGNLQDEATALLRIARAFAKTSTLQLEGYAYEAAFRGIPADASTAEVFARAAPVKEGQALVAIPRAEARAHARLEDLSTRASEARAGPERTILNERLIEEAEAFLTDYPTGYFAADAQFEIGGAELALGECRAARRTFEAFVERYPFHPAAPGARDKVEQAERCPRRVSP
jgi:hypothetical protein